MSNCSQNCGIPSGAIVLSGGSHPNVIKIGDTCYYKAVPTECCETPGISYEACSTCEDCHARIYLLTRCTPGSNIIISSRNTGAVNLDNYLGQVVKLVRPNACFTVSEAPQCTMPNRREPVVIETTVDNCQVPECDVCDNECDFVEGDQLIQGNHSYLECICGDEDGNLPSGSDDECFHSSSPARIFAVNQLSSSVDLNDCIGPANNYMECIGSDLIYDFESNSCTFISRASTHVAIEGAWDTECGSFEGVPTGASGTYCVAAWNEPAGTVVRYAFSSTPTPGMKWQVAVGSSWMGLGGGSPEDVQHYIDNANCPYTTCGSVSGEDSSSCGGRSYDRTFIIFDQNPWGEAWIYVKEAQAWNILGGP